MKFDKILVFILLLIFASSCNKDDEMTPTTEINYDQLKNYNPEQELVTATLLGTVIDELENPVIDATITHRGQQYKTNDDGIFIIKDQIFDKKGSFFTVHKDGFFEGSRRFYPQGASTNYAYVQLLELKTIGEFDASIGGNVVGLDNIEVSFPSNSILTEDGVAYSGQVAVAAKWLNPTSPNINLIMPGDLLGLDADGEEKSLVSYGMMAVELLGSAGEKLNLDPESLATLTFPVPTELIDDAPEEIPLWSFEDEEFGIWVEEGVARLEGGKYVGDVSHFSFWNCDAPFDLIEICGQLVTDSGIPISNITVIIESEELDSKAYGITDSRGFFSGKVPLNSKLILSIKNEILNVNCLIGTTMFGPFSYSDGDKINLGLIELETLQAESFNVFGNLLDCENNAVTNGLLRIKLGQSTNTYLIEEDGTFNIGLLNCTDLESFTIITTNVESLIYGDLITKNISPSVDCGNLSLCENVVCETDLFVGGYMLTLDDDAGLGYGPPYFEQTVTVSTVPNSPSLRQFSADILPSLGGFGSYNTTFRIDCEGAFYLLLDTYGLGCGEGSIMFGPAFDSDGQQIPGPINLEDDSEIILYFNEGFDSGGCDELIGETQTRMVLTKI